MDSEESRQQAREARMRVLEERISRGPAVGVRPWVAVVAILGGALLLGLNAQETAYFFSEREPLVLGTEGEYRFDLLASNRYAQLHGVPTLRGVYQREGDEVFVIVGLRDTPILVRRRALPTEEWKPGQAPPQPDQRPFRVGGRLLSETDAPRFGEAFLKLKAWDEVRPRAGKLWLLDEGRRPGMDRGILVADGLLLTFMAVNAYLLVRGVFARRKA